MPQMAPINWLSLFFIFCITFIMFNVLNYFSFNMNNNNSQKKLMTEKKMNNKNFYWKW